MKRTILIASIALSVSLLLLLASDPTSHDWPMWGGTPDRNMVSTMKGLPTTWDVASKKNVKWMAQLGSQSYGNPVVAGGQVYVGTNNELLRNPKEGGDRGVLMCFRESDGKFLWQHANEKLPVGRANDWPFQGVCSSPLVEGDRLYYVSNRCELVPGCERRWQGRRESHLEVRHDGGSRLFAAQHVELFAGLLRRSHLRQHLQRAGRKPRPHTVAARSVHDRGEQEDR